LKKSAGSFHLTVHKTCVYDTAETPSALVGGAVMLGVDVMLTTVVATPAVVDGTSAVLVVAEGMGVDVMLTPVVADDALNLFSQRAWAWRW